MIADRWGIKDHCVDCGLPCIRTAYPHYAAGATVCCDECGTEWDVPFDSPEMSEDFGNVHLCDRCAAKCDGKAVEA